MPCQALLQGSFLETPQLQVLPGEQGLEQQGLQERQELLPAQGPTQASFQVLLQGWDSAEEVQR